MAQKSFADRNHPPRTRIRSNVLSSGSARTENVNRKIKLNPEKPTQWDAMRWLDGWYYEGTGTHNKKLKANGYDIFGGGACIVLCALSFRMVYKGTMISGMIS